MQKDANNNDCDKGYFEELKHESEKDMGKANDDQQEFFLHNRNEQII